jgi:hypothetical protein
MLTKATAPLARAALIAAISARFGVWDYMDVVLATKTDCVPGGDDGLPES